MINKGFSIEGGVEKFCREFCGYKHAVLSHIDVLSISSGRHAYVYKTKNGLVAEHPLLFERFSFRFSISFTFAVFKKCGRYDKILINYPDPLTFWLLSIAALVRPSILRNIVVYYHNHISPLKPFARLVVATNHLILKQASAVVFTSENLCLSYKKKISNASFVPLGVRLNNEIKFHENNQDITAFTFVGRLEPVKGLEYLVKACDELVQQNNHFVLNIVGEGSLGDSLKLAAQEKKLNNLFFHGRISEKEKFSILKETDVLILPSTSIGEGFGYVCLEAMISSCACITTELGTGTSFVNQHGFTGLVVAPGDSNELAAAMERFITDKRFLHDCKKNAFSRSKSFSLEDQMAKLEEIILRSG